MVWGVDRPEPFPEALDRGTEGFSGTGTIAIEGERGTELGLGERRTEVIEARLEIVAEVADGGTAGTGEIIERIGDVLPPMLKSVA